MKNKLENFDVFMCDKCDTIIMIVDVHTLNQASNHTSHCICNTKLMERYKAELNACKCDIEFELVHRKYNKLLYE